MSALSPLILVLFMTLGSGAGFLAGLLGIGGGIILVPLFLWAFPLAGFPAEFTVHAAFATSLGIIVPTAVNSTLGHRKRGNVDWQQVSLLALGGVVGAVAGASLAAITKGVWLQILFGVMQLAVAGRMYLAHRYLPPERDDPVPRGWLVAVGFAGGAFSAFFGVGGGVVAVPLMVILLRLPIHLAVGNSSALIVISSFSGACSYILHGWEQPGLPPYSLGYLNLLVALLVAPFAMSFARLGVRVASRVEHDRLTKVFSCLLFLVGLKVIYSVLT